MDGYNDPSYAVQFFYGFANATSLLSLSDIMQSARDTLDSLKQMVTMETAHRGRLLEQLATGDGLGWEHQMESPIIQQGTNAWEVEIGFLSINDLQGLLLLNPVWNNNHVGIPDQFLVTQVVTFTLPSEMANWVKNLYDQSNPGGGVW